MRQGLLGGAGRLPQGVRGGLLFRAEAFLVMTGETSSDQGLADREAHVSPTGDEQYVAPPVGDPGSRAVLPEHDVPESASSTHGRGTR